MLDQRSCILGQMLPLTAEQILYGHFPPRLGERSEPCQGSHSLLRDIYPLSGTEAFWLLSGLSEAAKKQPSIGQPSEAAEILNVLRKRMPLMFVVCKSQAGSSWTCRPQRVIEASFSHYHQHDLWQLSPVQSEAVINGLQMLIVAGQDALSKSALEEAEALLNRLTS